MNQFFLNLWDRFGFLPFLTQLEPMPKHLLKQALDKETLRLARVISLGIIAYYALLIIPYVFLTESESQQALLLSTSLSIALLLAFFASTYLPFTNRYAMPMSVLASLIPLTNTLYRLYILNEIVITISLIIGIIALATIALDTVWLFCVVTYTCLGWLFVINQTNSKQASYTEFDLLYYAAALASSALIAILICRTRYHTIKNYSNLRWHESLQRKALEHAQEDLKAQNAELTQIDELKSAFLGNMSHELRTPLAAINGFTEVLQAETFGTLTEKQKNYLANISISGKQLLDMVNNVLTLSSFEANQLPMRPAHNSIEEVITTSLNVLKQSIDDKGLDVKLSLYTNEKAYFDSVMLNQVMLNLLSNAIKFSGNNTAIEIKSSASENHLTVEVVDSGIGISQENQALLFLPFSQVDSNYNRRHKGAGLGLALSKQIIEKHGGEMFVDSKLGEGSTFGFKIPQNPQNLKQAVLEPVGILFSEEKTNVQPKNQPHSNTSLR